MRRYRIVIAAALVGLASAWASAQLMFPAIYITPNDGFEVYLAAAMQKKKVPVRVVLNPEAAKYILTATTVQVDKISTGSKVVSCLFAYCAGTEDKANTSVHLTDNTSGDGTILWSYSVAKQRGGKNRQVLAEAIADHFKKEFLQRR